MNLAGRASPSLEESAKESSARERAAALWANKRLSLPVIPGAFPGANGAREPSPLSVEWEEGKQQLALLE